MSQNLADIESNNGKSPSPILDSSLVANTVQSYRSTTIDTKDPLSEHVQPAATEQQLTQRDHILVIQQNPPTTISNANTKHEAILLTTSDGHSLVQLNRVRLQGFCVECIKRKADRNYKKTMKKIITYCPKCPGGNWICEPCFNDTHKNKSEILLS